ncbi:two-component system, OmpR family, alkaline phosphatase synthesis response regulator PhoP [Desulfotomaculum arcticum]|uniref:Stage 0 sporulation protein A homolog n=1 Tax=Desulfotruncus arcticus DSM 17038 TaxID=1121424 RepID=A0A1I2UYF8_9FIRM|nr:response regulator transcription factor [Desulfotruncus arcticus]SFG82052.1 two-component system, OmpR family, alkaline phosphatase synthesis response regulator PhoP [Desulfotomaculum arcticum] [Desulfotruncus arcticus DSM 17038]
MPHTVLVVDDEKSIVRLVTFNLGKEGFRTLEAYDGNEALNQIALEQPDLVILDLMLPGIDGLEVCRRVRREGLPVAVIMLTAKDQEIDRVLGLELGADDYITKPFSPRELVARVKAVLRRTSAREDQSQPEEGIKFGTLTIDSERYEVKVSGQQVELTPKEFELLDFLARNAGKVMTRDILLNHIWDYTYDGDTRIVDVHISHLREKIEANPKNPVYIKTVRGVGYKFKGE